MDNNNLHIFLHMTLVRYIIYSLLDLTPNFSESDYIFTSTTSSICYVVIGLAVKGTVKNVVHNADI